MANKHHDMVVSVRLSSDQPANLRRFSVHYKLVNLIANYEHDVTDPKYKGDYVEFSRDMYQLLIKEVKSRVVARQEFNIWFYSEADMKYVVEQVLTFTKGNVGLEKFGDKLHEFAAVVPVKNQHIGEENGND